MTITKYDGVAILPKRCDRCNRLFWLEPYNIFYKTVGIEEYFLKQIECKNCIDKKSSNNDTLEWLGKNCKDCGNEKCKKLGTLPKGHGRIIDESQVTGTFTWDNGFIECFAPTIIEADTESEDKG